MNIDRVTITGADDSVRPSDLVELSARFPFVEWGILLSRRQEGSPRFPSFPWMLRLLAVADGTGGGPILKLSGHLCGAWVRSLCRGGQDFTVERAELGRMFQRVQLNFHAEPHEVDAVPFVQVLKSWGRSQYIFQFDDVNHGLMDLAKAGGIDAVPLFDTSGGAGVEPAAWPKPIGDYCGYAGGLHPDRLEEQLGPIAAAAGDARIWIDVETHVRMPGDAQLSLGKVYKFLKTAERWVQPSRANEAG